MAIIMIFISYMLLIVFGAVAGTLTVYVFNRIPAKWLCDYDEEPDKEMWGIRIKKRPWAFVFSLVFIACAVMLYRLGIPYLIAGTAAIWLLLQIGISDSKYMIIPDQYTIALAVTALGFIPFQKSFLSPLYGAIIGCGFLLLVGLFGRLIFKKEAMGFGDIKLLAALGLAFGVEGVIVIILMTVFSSAFVYGIGWLTGRLKGGDQQPLGPFIAAAASLYVLFRREMMAVISLYLG